MANEPIWLPQTLSQPISELQKVKKENVSQGALPEETLFPQGTLEQLTTNCPGSSHIILIDPPLPPFEPIEVFDINKVNSKSLDSLKAFFELPANAEVDMSKVSKRSDGKITDFYVDGKRYAVRYDSSGKINKVFEQEFDENGNVVKQDIRNYNTDGLLKNTLNYEYTYDDEGNRTGQVRNAVSAKYGNASMIMGRFFGRMDYSMTNDKFENLKVDSEGRLTDFYYEGKRYSLRYDENGNVEKTIVQSFHENGNIATQHISILQDSGWMGHLTLQFDDYTYDENGKQTSHRVGYPD